LDDYDDPVEMNTEVCFRRGYHQATWEAIRILQAGGGLAEIQHWESEISHWRFGGELVAMEGRKVDRLVPPYWHKCK
jgi:hypothetical protein